MNVRIFWVRAMECMCAQTRPRFILSSENIWGIVREPMLTPRKKSPLPEKSSPEEDRTHNAASHRTASPTLYQLSYSGPYRMLFSDALYKAHTPGCQGQHNRLATDVPNTSTTDTCRNGCITWKWKFGWSLAGVPTLFLFCIKTENLDSHEALVFNSMLCLAYRVLTYVVSVPVMLGTCPRQEQYNGEQNLKRLAGQFLCKLVWNKLETPAKLQPTVKMGLVQFSFPTLCSNWFA